MSFIFIISFFFVTPGYSFDGFVEDESYTGFQGCADFCSKVYLRDRKGDTVGYRQCIEQTRAEGKCGSGTQSQPPKQTPQQPATDPAQEKCQNWCLNECRKDSANVWMCPGRDCDTADAKKCQAQGKTCQPDGAGYRCEGNDPTAANDQCTAYFEQALKECRGQALEAVNSCDETQNSDVNSFTDMATQVALALGQQAASSVQAACSKMAGVAQAGNVAVAAYRGVCQSAIQSCNTSCDAALKYIQDNEVACFQGLPVTQASLEFNAMVNDVETQLRSCNSLNAKMEQAGQAIQNFGNTAAGATQCANQTSADGSALPDLCAAYPNSPGCVNGVVDCSNPAMAANRVCICARNPNDPSCVSGKAAGPGFTGGSMDSSSRLAGSGDSISLGSEDLTGLDPIQQGVANRSPGNSIDGKMGGGAGIGGGDSGGPIPGRAGGGGGGDDDPLRVNAGFYGSGSGAYGSGYRGGVGGAAGGGAGGGAPGAAGGPNAGPDLRAFLPGGRLDPRGVSGSSGLDGITGPHSNIWQKIQNRYRTMHPTLLP